MAIIRRLTAAVIVLLLLGDIAFAAAVWLTREPAPRPLTTDRVASLARPAMVLVQAEFDVNDSLPDPVVPAAQQQRIHDHLQRMINTGELPYDQRAIDRAAYQLILSDPGTYLAPGNARSSGDDQVYASGTGFFVTEFGELVTAAHVVAPTTDDVRKELIDFASHPDEVAQLRKNLAASIKADVGLTSTDAELNQLTTWYEGYVAANLTIDSVDSKFYLGTGTVHAGTALESAGIRATLEEADSPFPDRDLALLKADVTRVPALQLAPSDPSIGATAVIAGYPRKGYLQEAEQFDATVRAISTSGHVRDREPRADFTAYGTDATASPGNSGGPVLDGQGRVLGMLSYGEGDASAGAGYFIPASSIRDKLASAAVNPAPGMLTTTYKHALAEGDAHHYKHELPLLESVRNSAPTDAYVADDISRTQSALLAGQDRTPIAVREYSPTVIATSLAVALVAALVYVITALSATRRRKPTASLVSAAEKERP